MADSQRVAFPDALGAAWINDDGRFVIEDLIKGSPAFEAELQIGDQLLQVDGQAVESERISKVRDIFRDAGKSIRLDLKRGTSFFAKEVTLRRSMPYPPVWPRVQSKSLD